MSSLCPFQYIVILSRVMMRNIYAQRESIRTMIIGAEQEHQLYSAFAIGTEIVTIKNIFFRIVAQSNR